MAHGRYTGSEAVDKMRRTLTKIEFALMHHDDIPADEATAFTLLAELETDASDLAERLVS